jgi:hypothetical protein
VLVVFYAVAGAVSLVAPINLFHHPRQSQEALIRAIPGASPGGGARFAHWVAELAPLQLSGIARVTGSTVFFASLIGLLLSLLPADRWRWWHRAILGGGALVYAYGLIGIEPSRPAALALLSAPLGAALIAALWADEESPAARRGVALVGVVGVLAAVATASGGLRCWR